MAIIHGRKIQEIDDKDYTSRSGTIGENKVIQKLKQLSDDYHILCDVKIGLPYYIYYNGKKNLGTAQIDFVVVSKKGIFAIEVKNWSDEYLKRQNHFSPHEQAGRAGRILWHVLRRQVTSVVLSIKGNIEYDPKYKAVFVKNITNINNFIESRKDVLREEAVTRIVNRLKPSTADSYIELREEAVSGCLRPLLLCFVLVFFLAIIFSEK